MPTPEPCAVHVRHSEISPAHHPAAPATRSTHLRLNMPAATPIGAIDTSLLICGSAEAAMDLLPSETVQTVITSPPYWSLRDYGANGQIGRADALSEVLGTVRSGRVGSTQR